VPGFDNPPMSSNQTRLRWDIFCRVVDNYGDAGVCWRLATQLADAGERVRLFIDDSAPLAWMAPNGCSGVEVKSWPNASDASQQPGDVVIEAFGCDPPAGFVDTMAAMQQPPVWINLEYLSAESYVERSHRLPSPQRNGLGKWFFYPGFTPETGGLLREPQLMADRDAFDRDSWLAAMGLRRLPEERVVSLFCYANPAIPALLQALAAEPTLLLLTPGQAAALVTPHLTPHLTPRLALPTGLRCARLPWLTQPDFDHLLWASDINFVRGEDSLVRALWAGSPFVWQLYPQHDGAHFHKLEAMLQWLRVDDTVAMLWRRWNGAPGSAPLTFPPGQGQAFCQQVRGARQRLLEQTDLVSRLRAFVQEKRLPG
jgi:uncharacterized repeat protein (TIGR03837 family)